MTVEEIRELARERKLIYAEWLSDLKPEQGEILLSAIRDALQYENGRAEHLDTKGNYILAAGLAGLAAMTAVSKPVLEDLTGWAYRLTFSALLLTLLALFGAVLLVL
jgi:hypothetical protein